MNSAIALGALGFSVLTSIIALTTVFVTMKNNVTRLEERDKEQCEREEKAARELTELLVLLKTFMAEQSQINKTVEIALTGVVNEIREMRTRTVESATIVSLLTEVLRKAEIKGLEIKP